MTDQFYGAPGSATHDQPADPSTTPIYLPRRKPMSGVARNAQHDASRC
jgi:hypothetical protein